MVDLSEAMDPPLQHAGETPQSTEQSRSIGRGVRRLVDDPGLSQASQKNRAHDLPKWRENRSHAKNEGSSSGDAIPKGRPSHH